MSVYVYVGVRVRILPTLISLVESGQFANALAALENWDQIVVVLSRVGAALLYITELGLLLRNFLANEITGIG